MHKSGVSNLPLHGGQCPRWLFSRMVKLGSAISEVMVYEHGQDEFLKRLANPFWFQAYGCVLGFDWHSSGVTTTVLGAQKEIFKKLNLGIQIAGGKGKTSRKAPEEIENTGFSLSSKKIDKLKYSSKLSAKVDSNLLQDGYNLYTHSFMFTEKGRWCVVQQGMNTETRYARRYHWLSDNITSFIEEPHSAVCCNNSNKETLNMTAKESKEAQKISVDLVNDNPKHLEKYFRSPAQTSLNEFSGSKTLALSLSPRHSIPNTQKIDTETLKRAYELQPKDYEELIAVKGVGAKTIRSLALISELIYGKPPSWKEPRLYAFAHGGKDGFPRPVDKGLMDSNAELLKNAVKNAKIGYKDKLTALKRLGNFI